MGLSLQQGKEKSRARGNTRGKKEQIAQSQTTRLAKSISPRPEGKGATMRDKGDKGKNIRKSAAGGGRGCRGLISRKGGGAVNT